MTLQALLNSYNVLAQAVNDRVPGACSALSVKAPAALQSELDFTRLVHWGFAILSEAARVPCGFLGQLPPGAKVTQVRAELSRLRTHLSHNLSVESATDRKTLEFLRRWFREACDKDFPEVEGDFGACCVFLAGKIAELMTALVDAARLLNDPVDGDRLCEDLRGRVSLDWPAHKFDRVAEDVGERLGAAGIDLKRMRELRLDAWRRALTGGQRGNELHALELQIEADLVEEMAGRLPVSANAVLGALELSKGESLIAALIAIRAAHLAGVRDIGALIESIGGNR